MKRLLILPLALVFSCYLNAQNTTEPDIKNLSEIVTSLAKSHNELKGEVNNLRNTPANGVKTAFVKDTRVDSLLKSVEELKVSLSEIKNNTNSVGLDSSKSFSVEEIATIKATIDKLDEINKTYQTSQRAALYRNITFIGIGFAIFLVIISFIVLLNISKKTKKHLKKELSDIHDALKKSIKDELTDFKKENNIKIRGLERTIYESIDRLEKKMNTANADINNKIDSINQELEKKISITNETLEGKIEEVKHSRKNKE